MIYLEFEYTQFCLNLLQLTLKAVDKLTLQYREFFHTGVKDNSHAKDRFPGVRTRVGSRGLQVNKTFVTAIK